MPRKPQRNLPVKLENLPVNQGFNRHLADSVGDLGLTREQVLEIARVTPAEVASWFRRGVDKLVSLLDAKETKFFVEKGEVVQHVEVDNLELQRRAAVDLATISGGMPSKTRQTTVVRPVLIVDNLGGTLPDTATGMPTATRVDAPGSE